MNENDILAAFSKIQQGNSRGRPSLAKPALILAALEHCVSDLPRLATLKEYEERIDLIGGFAKSINVIYPFKRLTADNFWEVENSSDLSQSSSGDFSRKEIIEKQIRAGFLEEVYNYLIEDKNRIKVLALKVLYGCFDLDQAELLINAFPNALAFSHVHYQTVNTENFLKSENVVNSHKAVYEKERINDLSANPFISYLNSLHNVDASGANALAESQAQNEYFSELYEPFPIVSDIVNVLTGSVDRVVVLTGHAGDGKSTVALDVYKKLHGISPSKPLDSPLLEQENIDNPFNCSRNVKIVKDMSELSIDRRLEWLRAAFGEAGSWLIVSNTGPLLNSLQEYSAERKTLGDLQSRVLRSLNLPYHRCSGFFRLDFPEATYECGLMMFLFFCSLDQKSRPQKVLFYSLDN